MRASLKGLRLASLVFVSGGTTVAMIVALEAPFHYPGAAHAAELLPATAFTLCLYGIFSAALLPFFLAVLFVLQVALARAGRSLPSWCRERLPGLWSLFVAGGFLLLIRRAGLEVPMLFYSLLFALVCGLMFAGTKRAMAIASGATFGCLLLFVLYSVGRRTEILNRFWSEAPKRATPGRPNILLLVADTTRRDHLNFYGYHRNTMPRMGRLASRAVVFENVFAPSSWTKPATAALLTGRFLTDDPVHQGAGRIGWPGPTIAGRLKELGYDTALFSANSNASSFFGHARGYSFRLHSLPPEHAALQRFAAVRFFEREFGGRPALALKNLQVSLLEYATFLRLRPERLSDFANSRLDSPVPLDAPTRLAMRRQILDLTERTAAEEMRSFPTLAPVRRGFLFRWLKDAYAIVLHVAYLRLEGAHGQIVEHWIKDRELTDRFIAWHRARTGRPPAQPFFAHLQYMGPHTPYAPQLPDLMPHFDAGFIRPTVAPPTQHTPPSVSAPQLPARKLYNLIASYDDTLRNTDANMFRLIAYLRDCGELERTIVIFVSDHGEAFYEHGTYGHMNSLHRELLEVPLFVYAPSRLKPARVHRPASLADVFPTILTLVAAPGGAEERFDGSSLFRKGKHDTTFVPFADRRPDFEVRLATLVGGAWKLKRKSPLAFGRHTGLISRRGKLIREDEETGMRFLTFRSGDRLEERRPMRARDLTPDWQPLLFRLPAGPER